MASHARRSRVSRSDDPVGMSNSRALVAGTKTSAQTDKRAGIEKKFSLRARGFRSVKLHAENLVYRDERDGGQMESKPPSRDKNRKTSSDIAYPPLRRNPSAETEHVHYRPEDCCADEAQNAEVTSTPRRWEYNATTRGGGESSGIFANSPAKGEATLKHVGLDGRLRSFHARGLRSVKWATKSASVVKVEAEHRRSGESTEGEEREGASSAGNVTPAIEDAEEIERETSERADSVPSDAGSMEGDMERRAWPRANQNDLATSGRSSMSIHHDNEPFGPRSDWASPYGEQRERDHHNKGDSCVEDGLSDGGDRRYERPIYSSFYTNKDRRRDDQRSAYTLFASADRDSESSTDHRRDRPRGVEGETMASTKRAPGAAGERPGLSERVQVRENAWEGVAEEENERQDGGRQQGYGGSMEKSGPCCVQAASDEAPGRPEEDPVKKEIYAAAEAPQVLSRVQALRAKFERGIR